MTKATMSLRHENYLLLHKSANTNKDITRSSQIQSTLFINYVLCLTHPKPDILVICIKL